MRAPLHPTDRPCGRARRCSVWAPLVLAILPGPLYAADALEGVPRKVAAVLTISHLDTSNQRIGDLIRRFQPGCTGYDTSEFEASMGLNPGTIDTSRPIHVVFLRRQAIFPFLNSESLVDTETPYPVIAFFPADPAGFAGPSGGASRAVRRRRGSFGEYYLFVRDGIAFVANKRKPLLKIRGVEPGKGLAAALDADLKTLFAEDDVVVHLPLARWRESIKTYHLVVSNFLRVAAAAQADAQQAEHTRVVMDWFLAGVRDALDQMESVTFAFGYDGRTLRLDHYFAFRPGGSIADHLERVSAADIAPWTAFPDQPFLLLGLVNWQCPPGESLSCRFGEFLSNTDLMKESMSADERRKLLACMRGYNDGIKGMEFMFTSPEGQFRPFRVLGHLATDDAPGVMRDFRFVQEHMGELMGAFMPGGSMMTTKLEETTRDGIDCLEMKFSLEQMPEPMRRQMVLLYGSDVRVQQTAVGTGHIVYTMGEPPCGVALLMKTLESGRHVGRNRRVRRIQKRLLDDSNIVFIADAGRMLGTVRPLMEIGRAAAGPGYSGGSLPASGVMDAARVGPMFGWSCRARPHALHGRLAIDAADAVELADLAKHIFETHAAPETPTGEPPPASKSPGAD